MACGSSAAAKPETSPSASPISSATAYPASSPSAVPSPASMLYAVLEPPALYQQNTTVAIAGLDGYARAKAHFVPRSYPYAPDSAVVMAPEAHVAAGVVYFIDGRGVVRALAPSGVVRQVATFPLALKQQEISFAVSPDGKQLVAAILTFPAVGKLISGTGWHELVGPWKLQVDQAELGGTTIVLHQWQATGQPSQPGGFANIVMAGWDAQGPVAVIGSNYSTQNPQFDHQTFYGGHFANIDTRTGLAGSAFGGCQGNSQPWSVAADGTTVCATSRAAEIGLTAVASVRSPGQPLWEPVLAAKAPFGFPGSFVLSEDGSRLAMDGAVASRSGPTLPLNEQFKPQGWLDADTLIGTQLNKADPNKSDGMAYLRLSSPNRPVILGFAGEFVGTIN
jgi:hypothetical protein